MKKLNQNNENSEIKGILIDKLIIHPLRIQIFLLLFFYKELNVSQIAHKIHKSKATISRHLNNMEADGVLASRIISSKGKIPPRSYHIPLNNLLSLLPFQSQAIQKIPEDPEKRLLFYQNSIESIRSIVLLIQNSFGLMLPFVSQFQSQLDNIDKADLLFERFFLPETARKIDFQTMTIAEQNIPAYHRLYQEFHEKVEQLSLDNPGDHAFLVFNSLIPMKKILELDVVDKEN